MRVLVTGATGFLGSWMARRLDENGHEVVVLARSRSDLSPLKGVRYVLKPGDVTNLESFVQAADGCDAIFHLAGLVAYTPSDYAEMKQVNVGGTANAISVTKLKKIKRLVHMSSVVAIGASFDGRPLDENSEYNVAHLHLGYFETKRAGEALVREAFTKNEIDAVILNPGTIYGAGDARKGSRKTQVKVARGEFLFYPSGGVNVVSVHDVVDATLTAWKTGRAGERYILGGENLTIKNVFEIIAEAAGVRPPKIFLPNALIHVIGKLGDKMQRINLKGPLSSENAWTSTLFNWFDSTKAERELGLKKTAARNVIFESVTWMRDNGFLKKP